MLSGFNPITKLLLFHDKKSNIFLQRLLWVVLYKLFYSIILFTTKKENNDNMPSTLIPGCSNLSKMTQDTPPPLPKAAHLTVLLCNLQLTFAAPKQKTWGRKKGL